MPHGVCQMTLVESTCRSKDSSSVLALQCHIWTKYFPQLIFSVLPPSANLLGSAVGVYLSVSLQQHYFYFEKAIHLFWCTGSSRKGSMKNTGHQHNHYWQKSGDELGLNLVCFLVVCFGCKTLVYHFTLCWKFFFQ